MERKNLFGLALLVSTALSALFLAQALKKIDISTPVLLTAALLLFLVNGLIAYLSARLSSGLLQVVQVSRCLAQGKSQTQLDLTEHYSPQIRQILEELQAAAIKLGDVRKREQALLENAQDVICMLDLHGVFRSVTPASKVVLGYGPDDLEGKGLIEYLVQEDVNQTLSAVLGAENSIQRIAFENKFRKPNGEVIDLLWSAHWSASDRGLFCVARDNTDRKRAELALKESEARIRFLMDHMPAALFVLSSDGRVSFQNSKAQDILEKPTGDVIGKNIFELLGAKSAESAEKFRQLKQSGTSKVIEEKIINAHGSEQRLQVALEALEEEYLAILMDVTEHHEYRSLRERLVAMVIHDLRSPLTTLNLTLELMEDGEFGSINDDLKSRIGNCRSDVTRVIRMMKDLLKVAKYDADHLEIQSTSVPLPGIVSEAIAACAPIAQSRNIALSSNVHEVVVIADKDRIIQVILNLVTNAVKNSPSGSNILIEGRLADGMARVSVSDEGAGIDPSKLDLIFRPYQQSSWRDSEEKLGIGLGLPICKTIVEAHGGVIEAANNAASGATLSFTLPLA